MTTIVVMEEERLMLKRCVEHEMSMLKEALRTTLMYRNKPRTDMNESRRATSKKIRIEMDLCKNMLYMLTKDGDD